MEKINDLEEKRKKLKLSEGESMNIIIEEDEAEELKYKEDRSVVWRVCSTRVISKEVLGSTMAKVWRISKATKFLEVCANTFVIIFDTQANKQRVWARRPWLFDSQLLVLKSFDGFTPPQWMKFDTESFWVKMHNLRLACMTKA